MTVYMYMCDFPVKNWCKVEKGMCGTVLQSNIRQLVKTAKNRFILFLAARKKLSKIGPYYFRRLEKNR
jgi:hypothetical protein